MSMDIFPRFARNARFVAILNFKTEARASVESSTKKSSLYQIVNTIEFGSNQSSGPYDSVIVDEAQYIGISQLQWLAAMGTHKPDTLFFTGDLGQRIFQQAFSWKLCGVDIRGRSRSLKHLAKGLEFRAVVLMACDDEVIRLQSRVETATDQNILTMF